MAINIDGFTATVSDLINASMRSAGILATGESASASEAQEALLSLNQVMENFTIRGQMVYATDRLTFSLVPSQQVYTLGAGGDFNVDSPFYIYNASIIQNGAEQPIFILKTTEEWQLANNNSYAYGLSSNLPYSVFLTGDYPLNQLYIYPTPTDALQIALYIKKALTTFDDIFQSVNFPRGYFEALMCELAKRICIENGRAVTADLLRQSQRANQNLVSINAEAPLLKSPFINRRINGWWF
jgi:hypothetical protein